MISSWFSNLSWRKQRQLVLILIPLIPAVFIAGYLTYNHITSATCSDGILNQGELGIDCEGPCANICSSRIVRPEISGVGAYPTLPGTYNLGAVIENQNSDLGINDFPVTLIVYDAENNELYRQEVLHDVRPATKSLIFEGPVRISETPDRVVAMVNFDSANWSRFTDMTDLVVEDMQIQNPDNEPKAFATIINQTRESIKNLPVGVIVKNEDGEIVSISNSVLDINPRSESQAVFTWPAPFPTTKGVCVQPVDLLVALDASGSMNDLGNNPPQPITAVKQAAMMFASLFSTDDRFGVITFADQAETKLDPMDSSDQTRRINSIESIVITEQAEVGYTNLASALDLGNDILRNLGNSREQALVVLTDGEPTSPDDFVDPKQQALLASGNLKSAGVDLYAIGLGSAVDQRFLQQLTGDDSKTFVTLSSGQVETIYQQIATAICERAPYGIEVLPNLDL